MAFPQTQVSAGIDVHCGDKDLTNTQRYDIGHHTCHFFTVGGDKVKSAMATGKATAQPLPIFDIRKIVMRGDVVSWSIMAHMSEKDNPGCMELAVVYLYTSEKLVTRRKNAGHRQHESF